MLSTAGASSRRATVGFERSMLGRFAREERPYWSGGTRKHACDERATSIERSCADTGRYDTLPLAIATRAAAVPHSAGDF